MSSYALNTRSVRLCACSGLTTISEVSCLTTVFAATDEHRCQISLTLVTANSRRGHYTQFAESLRPARITVGIHQILGTLKAGTDQLSFCERTRKLFISNHLDLTAMTLWIGTSHALMKTMTLERLQLIQ